MRENQVSILHLEAKLKILLFSVKHMKQQAVLYLRLCIVMYYDKGSDMWYVNLQEVVKHCGCLQCSQFANML